MSSCFKEKIPRDKKYLSWIRTLPCCVRSADCSGPVAPHHTARAFGGLKGSDYSCVPICFHHHNLVQYYQWKFKDRFHFIPDEDYAKDKYFTRYNDQRQLL